MGHCPADVTGLPQVTGLLPAAWSALMPKLGYLDLNSMGTSGRIPPEWIAARPTGLVLLAIRKCRRAPAMS